MLWHVLLFHFVLRNNMESSLNIQIGGNHYKKFVYQPVQFAVDMHLNFIQGNIIKYISRYRDKGGNQDLKKVLHYAELGAELGPANFCPYHKVVDKTREFMDVNNLNDEVTDIIRATCYQDWLRVAREVEKISV